MLGRNILASSSDPRNPAVTLRIYDVLQGKDLWKQTFAPNSIVLQSEDPRLAGVAEPTGTVRVIDLQTQKEVFKGQLANPKQLVGAQSVALVSDPEYLYIAINSPPDPNLVAMGMPGGSQASLQTTAGLRSIPVNGMVYSFRRKTGEVNWFYKTKNQQMVLSLFDELPVVLFAAPPSSGTATPLCEANRKEKVRSSRGRSMAASCTSMKKMFPSPRPSTP